MKKKLEKLEKKLGKSWEKLEEKKIGKNLNFFQLFFSTHHSDQMSDGSQVSKVTICVQILKWHRRQPRVGIEMPGQLKILLYKYTETQRHIYKFSIYIYVYSIRQSARKTQRPACAIFLKRGLF